MQGWALGAATADASLGERAPVGWGGMQERLDQCRMLDVEGFGCGRSSVVACREWPLQFPEFLLVSTFPSLPGWDWETSFPAFEETKGGFLKHPLEQE